MKSSNKGLVDCFKSWLFFSPPKNFFHQHQNCIQQCIMSVTGETQARRYATSVFDYTRRELPKIVEAAGFEVNEYTVPEEEVARWINIAGKPLWKSWVSRMKAKGYKVASKILEDAIKMVKEYGIRN